MYYRGREKNFEDPMQSDQVIRKTRYGQRRFFRVHPLVSKIQTSDWSASAINIGKVTELISSKLTLNLNTQLTNFV